MKKNFGEYVLMVTGSVPLNDDGIYTTIGGRPVEGDPRGSGEGRQGRHRGGRLRALGQHPGGAAQSHRRRGRQRHRQGQAGREHRGLPADRRRGHGDDRALPDVRQASRARLRGPAAVRLRRAHPRPVPAARQLRRRPVRRGVRRRGGAQGLVPVPRRLQGTGDVLAVPDLHVEHAARAGRSARAIRASAAPSATSGTR